jgi:ABC-type lipopolysaccharide export system ATPase subunit
MYELARRGVFFWSDQAMLPLNERVSDLLETVRHHVPDAAKDAAIEVCGLSALQDHRTHQLSGGERRRVELAIVMARRPAVLLADEPFLGVMPRDRELLHRVFQWLTSQGTGILVTGHEVDTLFDLADDVIWMTAGTTHHLGAPERARRHDQFRREYLGPRAFPSDQTAGR